MAALTKSAAVGAAWTEVTAALGMADGSSYRLEVQDDAGTGFGHVIAVHTDTNDAPPADARGHQWYPRTAAGGPTRGTYAKKANRWLWMRSADTEGFHAVATVT